MTMGRGRDRLPKRGLGLREDFCPVGDHEPPRRPNGAAMTMKSKKRKALTTAGWRVG